jgi:hypothetical protein
MPNKRCGHKNSPLKQCLGRRLTFRYSQRSPATGRTRKSKKSASSRSREKAVRCASPRVKVAPNGAPAQGSIVQLGLTCAPAGTPQPGDFQGSRLFSSMSRFGIQLAIESEQSGRSAN